MEIKEGMLVKTPWLGWFKILQFLKCFALRDLLKTRQASFL